MTEPPAPGPDAAAQIRANLLESARLLREAHHIDPEAQRTLADLVEELGQVLGPASDTSSVHAAHLAESSTHLVQALHQRHDDGVLASARARLAAAAARAESDAPVATGIARRLIDALSDLGI
ncbi:MAG TPA: DUF4404 family protein [Isosphaeraceae bacterium]|jgi:hypothetical protein